MPLSKKKLAELKKQIKNWGDAGEYGWISAALEAVPEEDRDNAFNLRLAKAYVDSVVYKGSEFRKSVELTDEEKRVLKKAVGILRPMEEQMRYDSMWNACMMEATYLLGNDKSEAIGYAKKAVGLENLSDEEFGEFLDSNVSDKKNIDDDSLSEEDQSALEQYIEKRFGVFQHIFSSIVKDPEQQSPVDICIISPNRERSYYILVTEGLSDKRMNSPAELGKKSCERAELVIKLPIDWKISEKALENERWSWPLNVMAVIAALIREDDEYFYPGKTFDWMEGKPYTRGTNLCSVLITESHKDDKDSDICTLPSGEQVHFYQLIPIYKEEKDFIAENGKDAFFEKYSDDMKDIVDLKRRNVITGEVWKAKKHK